MRLAMERTVQYALIALMMLSLAGCSSLQTVDATPDSMTSKLSIGDNLIVTTRDGQQHEFVLLDIEEDFLVGKNERVATKDIVKVERYVHEKERSYLALAAFFVLIIALLLSIPGAALG